MISSPTWDASSEHLSPKTRSTGHSPRRRTRESIFPDIAGYISDFDTEGRNRTSGISSALRIWPDSAQSTNNPLSPIELRRNMSFLSPSGRQSFANTSRDDISTVSPVRGAHRPPPPTVYTVQEEPKLAIRPRFHSRDHSNDRALHEARRGSIIAPSTKSAPTVRSQRLNLSRLFGRDKEAKRSKKVQGIKVQEKDTKSPTKTIYAATRSPSDTEAPAAPKLVSQRSRNTIYERNATDNAKVNQRRPPKGIQHWFEGVSDDDLPEVVLASPERVTTATFRPALGPSRLRAAPTSLITPPADPVQAFVFNPGSNHHDHVSIDTASSDRHEQSILNFSDSDESDPSSPLSPARYWTAQRLQIPQSYSLRRAKSTDGQDSMSSAGTTMTSVTIPIMNADTLYRTPLPSPHNLRQHATDVPASPLRMMRSESNMGRHHHHTVASSSTADTSRSNDTATNTANSTQFMAVTQEEMALLEMMRRKRAEMQGPMEPTYRRASSARQYEDANAVVCREDSAVAHTKTTAFSITSSNNSVFGAIFPAPPSSSATQSQRTSALDARALHIVDEDKFFFASPMTTEQHQDPETSSSPAFYAELEAPGPTTAPLPTAVFSPCPQSPLSQFPTPCKPVLPFHHRHKRSLSSSHAVSPIAAPSSRKIGNQHTHKRSLSSSGIPRRTSSYSVSDPYQLALDLDFSPLLIPLGATVASPPAAAKPQQVPGTESLPSLSRSSEASQFSTTTTNGRATGAVVGGQPISTMKTTTPTTGLGLHMMEHLCELDVKRNSCVRNSTLSGAGNDVLAAWSALGGGLSP